MKMLKPVASLAASVGTWSKSGFKVSVEAYNARMSICNACEHWDDSAYLGYGKCRLCGCGRGKQLLPHEKCPAGKWGGVDPLTPDGQR